MLLFFITVMQILDKIVSRNISVPSWNAVQAAAYIVSLRNNNTLIALLAERSEKNILMFSKCYPNSARSANFLLDVESIILIATVIEQTWPNFNLQVIYIHPFWI